MVNTLPISTLALARSGSKRVAHFAREGLLGVLPFQSGTCGHCAGAV